MNRAVRACYIRLFFNIAILDGRDNDQLSLQIQALKGENPARFERNDATMLRLGSDHRAIALGWWPANTASVKASKRVWPSLHS